MPLALVFDGRRYILRFGLWRSLVSAARTEKVRIWKLWNGVAGLASNFLRRILGLWTNECSQRAICLCDKTG